MSSKALAVVGLVLVLVAGRAMAGPIGIFDDHHDLGRPGDDPGVLGSATFAAGTYTVTGSGSDWWNSGEFGYYVFKAIAGDQRLEADVVWQDGDAGNQWKKAGVAFRNDVDTGAGNEKEVNYFAAITRPNKNRSSFQFRDVATGNMGSNTEGGGTPVKVAIQRWKDPEGDYLVQAFKDMGGGAGWEELGNARWAFNLNENAYLGLAMTSHEQTVARIAEFSNVQFTTVVAPGTLPRKPGEAVNDPEGVGPVMGGWGVLEVVNNGNMNNLDAAIASLESGTGDRLRYNLMGAININDHEGNAANFGNDIGYGVAYENLAVGAPWPAPGSVNDVAFLARGQVDIPWAGDWSFYCRSDDGEELAVYQGGVRKLVIGSDTSWNANCFGTATLAAGPADIQFIHREDGGGANLEVAATNGATTDLGRFRLIGSGDAGVPAHDSLVPAVQNLLLEQTPAGWVDDPGPPVHTRPENRVEALIAIEEARAEGVLLSMAGNVVNHGDADDGGNLNSGSFPGDLNYLNDAPGVDENDHAFKATGELIITVPGTYYLGYNSDDGASLEIAGVPWVGIVPGSNGSATILDDGDGDGVADVLQTDAWTGWSYTVGEIVLAAGAYELTYTSYEGGGGAFSELFGGTALDGLDLLTDTEHLVHVGAVADALNLIPEPATLTLLGIGLLGLIRRKR